MKEDQNHLLTFHNVWLEKSGELLDEIVETWKDNNSIPFEKSPVDRAKQVVYVVRNSENKIIAISTAKNSYIPMLKNHLFFYRCMILPDYRIPGLLGKITKMTLDYLESVYKNYSENIIGVITEIENPDLKRLNFPVLKSGFTFVGYSDRGNPVRVYYFKDARL